MSFSVKENIGGLYSMVFYLLEETASWPVVLTDDNSGQIVLTPEDVTVEGTIEPDSIQVKDKPKTGEEGQTWPIDIQFSFLCKGKVPEQVLEQYANKPGVAIGCLNDDLKKLWGSDQEPLYMTFENDYGDRPEDRTALLIRIKGETTQRPVFYYQED